MEAVRNQPIPLEVYNLQRNSENYPKGSYFQNSSQGYQPQQQYQPLQPMNVPIENNQNGYGAENVNQNLNQFVRNQLISRGVSLGKSPSPLYIRQQEQERKKTLLDNIQRQIVLTQNAKHQEKMNKKIEDDKYLQDMVNSFPFGRGGGGAPIRDKNGEIVATRRALISDPKYNLVSINVDDDYDAVWRKDKQYGLVNFKNKPIIQNTANILSNMQRNMTGRLPENYNWNQTIPMQRMSQGQPQQYDFNRSQSMYNEPMNNYGGQPYMNNYNPDLDYNYNRSMPRSSRTPQPYPSQPQYMDPQPNYGYQQMEPNSYNEPPSTYNLPSYGNTKYNNQQQSIPQGGPPFNNVEKAELNLSYDNYELDEDKRQRGKEIYKNQLQEQMREKEEKKAKEREQKEREDREEDERIRRENEELQRRLEAEKNKTQLKESNVEFINQYVVENKTKSKRANESKAEDDARDRQKSMEQEALIQFNQQEIESRMQLNSEILKLRDQMQDQQVNLFNQINSLKSETQNANMQRFEALKEIDSLKIELSKQRADEDLRRKYVYDVIVDDQSKVSNVYNQTHLPDTQIEKVELTTKKPKEVYYEETVRHPNRIIPNPKFDELKENQMKTASKFIDLDSHKMFDGLELYTPKLYSEEEQTNFQQVNNKGYELNEDFNPLRSYYNENEADNEKRFSDDVDKDIDNNIGALNDNHLEINQIYNKNLERLRFLNDIDSKQPQGRPSGKEGSNPYSKVNFDDFISKLNKTCELHES